MTVEYKGDDFLYLVEIPGELPADDASHRLFNQTDGSHSIEADEVELNTKDKSGSDYGAVTENVSIEGILTKNDPAIKYIRDSIRGKKLVKIIKVDTTNETTEEGKYKLNNFEQSDSVGEYSTYSIDATLNGKITDGTLTTVPEGAPDEEPAV